MLIDTPRVSERMRSKIVDVAGHRVLISRLAGTAQEGDLSAPVNCEGLGRVRHFHRDQGADWPPNFLPIEPAARYLGRQDRDRIEAQVFQSAACAWRCWYCYVPYDMLAGDARRARWMTADELVTLYAGLEDRPPVLDLSGGSPDLTPEWPVWMARALDRAGLADTTFLWSDDNLSTDYVFDVLSPGDRAELARPGYGRVCCFKGFDADSFVFNTRAQPAEWDRQFDRFARYLDLGWDLYAYVTVTGESAQNVPEKIGRFVDRLKGLHPDLPSRTVPLRIESFGPLTARNDPMLVTRAMEVQHLAARAWRQLVLRTDEPATVA